MSTQNVQIYSNCITLSAGCYVYTSSTLSIGTEAPDGYYSNGLGDCYRVLTGPGTGPGFVVNVSSCDAPPPYTFKLYNNSSLATITECRLVSGFAFYTQVEGDSIPPGLPPGTHLFGDGNTSSAVGVRIINGVPPLCQKLYKNGFLVDTKPINGNNIHYFTAIPFASTDEMKIVLFDGAC